MPTYCVNKNQQANGDHEVHDIDSRRSCLPSTENRASLGYHPSCSGAVRAAKQAGYSTANGCFYCANDCHTS